MKTNRNILTKAFMTAAAACAAYTMYAQSSTYKICDRGPAGGWIFYDKGTYSDGWRYLEAAPENQGRKKWGCQGMSINGAKATDVGTGMSNTQAIIRGCSEAGTAARLCIAYRGGGKSDWFLPSKDELYLMLKNLKKCVGRGLAGNRFWSSSEYNAELGWGKSFGGSQSGGSKFARDQVRAVRAF